MGLLEPTKGKLLVDNADIHDLTNQNLLTGWMSSIAHVPQHIFLADCSIAENIAFGLPNSMIDMDEVYKAAAAAKILEVILDQKDGFKTRVGERGVRLSGGQRQRIGIARALYRNSQILVLDEATSALDNSTELAVMSSIQNLNPQTTIIMIAHRLSTLKSCNRIIEFNLVQ